MDQVVEVDILEEVLGVLTIVLSEVEQEDHHLLVVIKDEKLLQLMIKYLSFV
jgi:hypothetical protein